jgi:predicted HTH domain antitoxin
MIYTFGHLYEQGKVSSGLGTQVLGVSRQEFYRLLFEHGFAVIDHTNEELAAEAQSSHKLAGRLRSA